jgi:hypothetical protein
MAYNTLHHAYDIIYDIDYDVKYDIIIQIYDIIVHELPVVATLACLRVNEVARLQVCETVTCGLTTWRRTGSQASKGRVRCIIDII